MKYVHLLSLLCFIKAINVHRILQMMNQDVIYSNLSTFLILLYYHYFILFCR